MRSEITESEAIAALKQRQREMWKSFAPTAMFTTPVAAHLVRFAGVTSGESLLDVGTGTGVVAITAAHTGARVSAIDLTPALLEEAERNARLAGVDVAWTEGDAEKLPYPDASFDVVLSQFGHMFAPRPEVVVAEIRRALKPDGRLAFATWPPEELIGQIFAFVGRNSAPPPPGVEPPGKWGVPAIITQRLAGKFGEPVFERGVMIWPALSLPHYRAFMESSVGPIQKLVESLANDSERLAAVRAEFETIAAPYYSHNVVNHTYLLTRAQ